MKRFWMLVGVAIVAAAMYVAASPASQQSKFATEKQFLALQKKVKTLSTTLKVVKAEANAAAGFIGACFLSTNGGVVGLSRFGNPNATPATGYEFNNGTAAGDAGDVLTTAIDADSSTTPGAWVQAVDPTCVNTSLRHRATHSGLLPRRGERNR
jgi:hypothetical protein